MRTSTGPGATAVWKDVSTADGTELQVIADETIPDRWYYLARHHRFGSDADGVPAVSLTLVLAELPAADQEDIVPLVRQASFAVRLELPLAPDAPAGFVPLFARAATISLTRSDNEPPLATVSASGSPISGPLTVTLEQADALTVLSAVHGQSAGGDLMITSEITYRAVAVGTRSRLYGHWAAVWDVLQGLHVPSTVDNLRLLYRAAIAAGAITVDPAEGADAVYPSFASSARAVLFDANGAAGPRPSEYFTLDLTSAASDVALYKTVTVSTPLHVALAGCLDDVDADRVISLVAVTPTAVGSPRKVRSAPAGRDLATATPMFAVAASGRLASTTAMLSMARPEATGLNAQIARAGRPAFQTGAHVVAFNDFDEDPAMVVADLPIAGDGGGWVYPARGGGASWYAPSFQVLAPTPTDDARTSPFLFSFVQQGATSSGQPGINATITFKLRPVLGPEAAAAGGDNARPLPVDNAQVVLDIPFRDANGASQRQRLTADTTWENGVLVAKVALIDDWARLAYGALSQAGFQVEPARISVSWSFRSWYVTGGDEVLAFGGKTALLELRAEPQVEGRLQTDPLLDPDPTYFNVDTATLVTPEGALQFQTASTRAVRAPVGSRVVVHPTLMMMRPINDDGDGIQIGDGMGGGGRPRPVDPRPTPPIIARRWLVRTVARSQVSNVLFPCAQLGSCYVQQRPEGLVAIGCQDALRLGQASWRQYEEIVALADPAYKVYRSLQQPGRFVVLPSRYTITRYPKDALKPYQPAVLLYALLDAADPASNQVVIQATLQADIDSFEWAALQDRLTDYAPTPILTLATDVEGAATFSWTLVGIPSVSLNAAVVPNGISVSIQSDLAHALLLRDMLTNLGIVGSLNLRLPDGTILTSTVLLGLANVSGPADRGPIDVAVTAGTATLVNRIERPVSVSALRVYADSTTFREIPVEQTLTPGGATSVAVAAGDGTPPAPATSCQPVYTVPAASPGDLTEVRSFVEDIRMNVVFLDLIDHPTHAIARLDVQAELVGASAVQPVAMTGSPGSGSASFVLPLTTYLSNPVVRYQVSVLRTDGSSAAGGWQTVDTRTKGNLISLNWETTGITP